MAALAGMMAKSMAKGMARDLKRNARGLVYDYRNQARAAATNYVDEKKNRIYQTAGNAFYTNTRGGRRNYNPVPAYYNRPGTNAYRPLY